MKLKRTSKCGKLRKEHIGQEIVVNGWVHRRRDLGGLIFVDLRDVSGIVQIVFKPEKVLEDDHKKADQGEAENEFFVNSRADAGDNIG